MWSHQLRYFLHKLQGKDIHHNWYFPDIFRNQNSYKYKGWELKKGHSNKTQNSTIVNWPIKETISSLIILAFNRSKANKGTKDLQSYPWDSAQNSQPLTTQLDYSSANFNIGIDFQLIFFSWRCSQSSPATQSSAVQPD